MSRDERLAELDQLIEGMKQLQQNLNMTRDIAISAKDHVYKVVGAEPKGWGEKARDAAHRLVGDGQAWGYIDMSLKSLGRAIEKAEALRGRL